MTVFCFFVTGFDSDNSSIGEFSEANKISGMIDLDTSKSTRSGKNGEKPQQENGIQKHRYAVLHTLYQGSPHMSYTVSLRSQELKHP